MGVLSRHYVHYETGGCRQDTVVPAHCLGLEVEVG